MTLLVGAVASPTVLGRFTGISQEQTEVNTEGVREGG